MGFCVSLYLHYDVILAWGNTNKQYLRMVVFQQIMSFKCVFASMHVWAKRKDNHSVRIKEIPKTQLGWLGQTQLVDTIMADLLTEWHGSRQNTVSAREKTQYNNCKYFGGMHITLYSLWGVPFVCKTTIVLGCDFFLTLSKLFKRCMW